MMEKNKIIMKKGRSKMEKKGNNILKKEKGKNIMKLMVKSNNI